MEGMTILLYPPNYIMACLDDIVTLGLCPDDGLPSSGLYLIDAPGISLRNLADIANETYVSGVEMAMQKKRLALTLLRNDFIGALQGNNVVANINNPVYDAANFNTTSSNSVYPGFRGVNLYKVADKGSSLRKMYLTAVEVYPLSSGDAQIKIVDGYKEYTYNVTLIAGQINSFGAGQLSGFPFVVESGSVRVMMDNNSIPLAKTHIMCHTGCSGTPNPCGHADGWNGTGRVAKDSFGLNVKFKCDCDYTSILCNLDKSYAGELIWLKWQIEIFEEQFRTNRFNSWVTYNHDELKGYILPDLKNRYSNKWSNLMSGMDSILKTYNDVCIVCKGIRWVATV